MQNDRRLGDILKEKRLMLGVTLERVVADTKIQKRILEAFEATDFDSMPPKGYARAALGSYARYLGLDSNQILPIYEDQLYEYRRGPNGAGQATVSRGTRPQGVTGSGASVAQPISRASRSERRVSAHDPYEASRSSMSFDPVSGRPVSILGPRKVNQAPSTQRPYQESVPAQRGPVSGSYQPAAGAYPAHRPTSKLGASSRVPLEPIEDEAVRSYQDHEPEESPARSTAAGFLESMNIGSYVDNVKSSVNRLVHGDGQSVSLAEYFDELVKTMRANASTTIIIAVSAFVILCIVIAICVSSCTRTDVTVENPSSGVTVTDLSQTPQEPVSEPVDQTVPAHEANVVNGIDLNALPTGATIAMYVDAADAPYIAVYVDGDLVTSERTSQYYSQVWTPQSTFHIEVSSGTGYTVNVCGVAMPLVDDGNGTFTLDCTIVSE